jgi:hypothetical protein
MFHNNQRYFKVGCMFMPGTKTFSNSLLLTSSKPFSVLLKVCELKALVRKATTYTHTLLVLILSNTLPRYLVALFLKEPAAGKPLHQDQACQTTYS